MYYFSWKKHYKSAEFKRQLQYTSSPKLRGAVNVLSVGYNSAEAYQWNADQVVWEQARYNVSVCTTVGVGHNTDYVVGSNK